MWVIRRNIASSSFSLSTANVHWYADGYFLKFEVRRVEPAAERPHGLRYSLTLHAPDGTRLIGFDNAHAVASAGSRFSKKPVETDHWHRTEHDPGRPYEFTDAATLIEDFFDEVERVLGEREVPLDIIRSERRKP